MIKRMKLVVLMVFSNLFAFLFQNSSVFMKKKQKKNKKKTDSMHKVILLLRLQMHSTTKSELRDRLYLDTTFKNPLSGLLKQT